MLYDSTTANKLGSYTFLKDNLTGSLLNNKLPERSKSSILPEYTVEVRKPFSVAFVATDLKPMLNT